MHKFIILLVQYSKSSSDSSSVSLKQITVDSFFSLNNPIIYSLLLLVVVLSLIFIFYWFVVAPMRSHFNREKNDLNLKHAQLMAAFAEMDPEPVFRFDETGKIVMSNEASEMLLQNGLHKEKKLVNIIPDLNKIDLAACIKEGKKIDFVTKLNDKSYKFTIIGLPEMNIGQIYGSDITELKKAELKIKEALKKAEDSEKIKSYFLAQMSHEIRSPLTAVLGFNSIIKEKLVNKIDDDMEFAFYAIDKSGRRLTRTIDQLLYMSQFQTESYEPKIETTNLTHALINVISEYKPEANLKNIGLTFDNKIGDAYVYADKYGLAQIFDSLIDNAVKYTSKGSVKVVLNKNENNKLYVSIADTGIGMSEEFVSNLFRPFTQERMGYNRPFEGNGLGLALSKKFADISNAEIFVKSTKDVGSEFTIVFNE